MHFEGEHLLPGQIGHFFVLLAFVASILSTIGYFTASRTADTLLKASWIRFARISFRTQVFAVMGVFITIFYICSHHYFEYMYAYKHASLELEPKYLLACIWEGQEGSFLLWTIWHSVLGMILIRKSKDWEAPVMSVVSLAQFFLLMMILGIYFFGERIGSSPFTLTRNEIEGPIFSMPNYLTFIKDGIGLNVLLRNYWMVIHPPILFLGFASTIIPFSYAYAGIQTKRFGEWIQPALPWALISACVLGTGIMMGGKWAYESLTFGGYWGWDPVENASLVPWLILVAGMHTMVIYKATGNSLRASYLFAFLTFIFILYSTFLTRTGILGDTSVHAFTEAGNAMNIMILSFVGVFTLSALTLFLVHLKRIPTELKEERMDSREFWMFIGSVVIFLGAMFIIAKTSVPVYNKIFGTKIAPAEDVEFSYNKLIILVAIIIGLLSAVTQYFKYKGSPGTSILKKIALPTLIAALITALLVIFYPITYYRQGAGFLGAIYVALFAAIYALVSNAAYIFIVLHGKMKSAGASVAHAGFALLLVGILLSSANKKVISNSGANGINLPASKDPMTKKQDDPTENLTLVRQVPASMGPYEVTYLRDSAGKEKGRKFYQVQFERKDPVTKNTLEHFNLWPDVYLMKDNNMSSNPDTKNYLNRDIFTYISYVVSDAYNSTDTSRFIVHEMATGDTAYYNNGYLVLNGVVKNPSNEKYHFKPTDAALMADITLFGKDSMHYRASPLLMVDSIGLNMVDDTVYAQNLYIKFAGVTDNRRIKLGIRQSDQIIDFITLKAYIFPYINLVWLGLVIMAIGLIMSAARRAKLSSFYTRAVLVLAGAAIFYMFLLAN